MGKKILAFATVMIVAAVILAALGSKLDSNAFAITGFAVSNAEEGRQTLTPADRVTEYLIRTSEDAVLIKIANATIGRLEGTNSMEPVLDSKSNTIMVKPEKAEEINEGDMIAYNSEEASGLVVHRIVKVGKDEKGWFAETKGDNSASIDPGKVRLERVRYVIIGILY